MSPVPTVTPVAAAALAARSKRETWWVRRRIEASCRNVKPKRYHRRSATAISKLARRNIQAHAATLGARRRDPVRLSHRRPHLVEAVLAIRKMAAMDRSTSASVVAHEI